MSHSPRPATSCLCHRKEPAGRRRSGIASYYQCRLGGKVAVLWGGVAPAADRRDKPGLHPDALSLGNEFAILFQNHRLGKVRGFNGERRCLLRNLLCSLAHGLAVGYESFVWFESLP